MIKEYLQTGRAQTASVEIGGFAIAGILSHAPLYLIIVYSIMGLFTHLGGFGGNSISDLKYDMLDPNKKSHPLVAGTISVVKAVQFIVTCQLIVILFFIMLAIYRSTYISFVPFILFILSGYVYNYYAKSHKVLGIIAISLSFAMIFLAFALLWNGIASSLIIAVTCFSFLYVMLQIAVLGEVKDIERNAEHNILRSMNLKIEYLNNHEYYMPSMMVTVFVLLMFTVRWSSLFVVSTLTMYHYTVMFVIYNIAIMLIFAYASKHYMFKHLWFRNKELKSMGMLEAFTYVLLVLSLTTVIGIVGMLILIFVPILWFFGMNKMLWSDTGSGFAPGV
jgi:4-hydroxybenzoate polyprenyltransferase